jgi:transposase
MESTGVYWIPVRNALEGGSLSLTDPGQPGYGARVAGTQDGSHRCACIVEYMQYGLLGGSFVPPRAVRQWRELTRMRVHVQQDRNRVINRIARQLETVNIKLSSVASNIVGKSGRAMLAALAADRSTPEQMANQALSRLWHKRGALVLALDGKPDAHFRWMLSRLLRKLEALDAEPAEIDVQLDQQMSGQADLIERLSTIPGVDRSTAQAVMAELGTNMSVFPDAAHLASWTGLCPGNAESAGKRLSGRTRKGDRYLRRALVQSASAAARTKNCFLRALFSASPANVV